jgi:DNA-binding NtrC family response regulator
MTAQQIHDILLGSSIPIRRVRSLIECVAPTELPVLIAGPTGSGKELVAHAIHAASGRRGRFVAFNACAIAETMFEDALFGHVRGAFTGAMNSSPGYLREANGGTAFLDEISGLTVNAQAKLLRAVETREFRPVGAPADVRSDFRLIAAANEDIWDLQQSGRFRADLAHRLSSFVIRVPPLRDRMEDVPMLANAFLREIAGDSDICIDKETLMLLKGHHWPGNVRELRHVVRSAATLGGKGTLSPENVREAISWMAPEMTGMPSESLADRRLIEVLEQCGWNADEAAKQLNVHRTTIYRRLKRVPSTNRRRNADASGDNRATTSDVGLSSKSA